VAVSPQHDEPNDEHDLYEEVPPRSIFAATWFRVVLVVIVLGVVGAVAVPWVLDWMNPPVARAPVTAKPSPTTPEKPASPTDKSPAPTEKRETTLIPAPIAPTTPAPALPPARSEPKSESKPAPTTARAVDSKPTPPRSEARAVAPPSEAKSKSAMAVPDKAKPDVAAQPASPPKPDTVAKADSKATAPSAARDDAKPVTATTAATATPSPAPKRVAAKATPSTASSGPFWVQVGAFRDAETAKRLAAKLREANFKVEESMTRVAGAAPARSAAVPAAKPASSDIGNDLYDVYVTGQTPDELTKRLSAKGLAAESSGAGMVVKPSLPLRDAVALSKDLAVEGFKVQVKRSAGASASPRAAAPAAPAPAESGGAELHRVRVGAFVDRAAALAAARELEAKGYKPFIARGDR
jgi:cell division protein FtsN